MEGDSISVNGISVDYDRKFIIISRPEEWTILLSPTGEQVGKLFELTPEYEKELEGKPMTEKSRSKLFWEVFNVLSDNGIKDVDYKDLEQELLRTSRFDSKSVRDTVNILVGNGMLYERQKGVYASTFAQTSV